MSYSLFSIINIVNICTRKMKQVKNFLMVLIMIFTLSMSSCNPTKTITSNTGNYGVSITSIKNISVDSLSVMQLDSLTHADKLPVYSKWNKSYIVDGDTHKPYEYATLYDKTTGIIYTVKYLGDKKVYVVQKKKTTTK